MSENTARSPLYAVLDALEQAGGPVSLRDLAADLHIEPAALEGMIAFWVRKGRLRLGGDASCSPAACGSCHAAAAGGGCPLVLHEPARYEVVPRPADPGERG